MRWGLSSGWHGLGGGARDIGGKARRCAEVTRLSRWAGDALPTYATVLLRRCTLYGNSLAAVVAAIDGGGGTGSAGGAGPASTGAAGGVLTGAAGRPLTGAAGPAWTGPLEIPAPTVTRPRRSPGPVTKHDANDPLRTRGARPDREPNPDPTGRRPGEPSGLDGGRAETAGQPVRRDGRWRSSITPRTMRYADGRSVGDEPANRTIADRASEPDPAASPGAASHPTRLRSGRPTTLGASHWVDGVARRAAVRLCATAPPEMSGSTRRFVDPDAPRRAGRRWPGTVRPDAGIAREVGAYDREGPAAAAIRMQWAAAIVAPAATPATYLFPRDPVRLPDAAQRVPPRPSAPAANALAAPASAPGRGLPDLDLLFNPLPGRPRPTADDAVESGDPVVPPAHAPAGRPDPLDPDDLDTLAIRLQHILQEEARRHGIDV